MMRITPIIFFLLIGWSAKSQIEMSLPSMSGLWQRNWLNPSSSLENEGFILSLPSSYFGFDHSGKPFKGVWSISDQTLFVDTDKWIDNLDDENDVISNFEFSTFQLAWRKKNLTWSIGHSFKNQLAFTYPKDLIELIHYGNAPYIGETLDVGVSADWKSYSSFHLGVAWTTDKFSLGGRLQFLNGIQYLNIEPSSVSLFTNEDIYQLEFTTDIEILSSAFISAEDIDALDFELKGLETFNLFSKNNGLAIDLGASFSLAENIQLNASVLDIGFINWEEAKKFVSRGKHLHEGLEISDISNFDTLSFKESLDTIGRILNVEEEPISEFNSNLTAKIYASLHWQVSGRLELSALYASESYLNKMKIAYGIGAHYKILDAWGIGSVVTNRFDKWSWGLNTRFNLGMVEVFLLSDNVISSISLGELNNGNVRGGINLIF